PNHIAPPAGFTERAERAQHPALEVSDMVFASAGATGERVARADWPADNIGTIFALHPRI
ncbi:MAG: hypothetical protein ACRDIF_05110, partial [Actinomycetota bacterium]